MNLDKTGVLVDAVQRLSVARDLQSVMEVVRGAARKLASADGATFILKDGDKCFYADEDAISPLWKGQRFPMESCVSGWAMIHKAPAIIEDIYADDRIPRDAYLPTFVKSMAMIPIRKLNPIGAIGAYWAYGHQATEEEVFLLQSLADITSVSVENVYLYKEMDDRVKERTRQLEDANKTLEAFNFSVSHDLKAPLRAFQGYLSILSQKLPKDQDEEAAFLVDRMTKAAAGMNELLIGLLDFSKAGSAPLANELIDMPGVVRDVCDSLNHVQDGAHPSFEINPNFAVE